ncbi:uncharacterized protein LOC142606281 [Castanea sativa]|uniref:uncharacterized protein LOC142606281 n=1 Tax=Castanea sativa TaxID=21020 RepID=UPI003F64A892
MSRAGHGKKAWWLAIQKKVRNFLLRAIRNSIIAKTNLVHRKILLEDTCNHCQQAPEDVRHALWQYPLLSPVWDSNPCWNFRSCTHFNRFGHELVQNVIIEGSNLDLFAQIIWTLWHRRNLLRTIDKLFPIEQVTPDVIAANENFLRVFPPKASDAVNRFPQRVKWKPPPNNCFKVNFDGAVFKDVKNEGGQVIASMAEKISLPNKVAAVEALAAVKL